SYYGVFQSATASLFNVRTLVFPEETYDYGVREAVAGIAAAAGPSADIVCDAPAVAAHYLRAQARPDLRVRSLSAEGIDVRARESWAVVQDEHVTFENQAVAAQLRAAGRPWREIRIDDRLALQIFHIGGAQR